MLIVILIGTVIVMVMVTVPLSACSPHPLSPHTAVPLHAYSVVFTAIIPI